MKDIVKDSLKTIESICRKYDLHTLSEKMHKVQMELDMGSPEYRTVNYQWGSGFEYCAITFQGDKVAMKMQIGLK